MGKASSQVPGCARLKRLLLAASLVEVPVALDDIQVLVTARRIKYEALIARTKPYLVKPQASPLTSYTGIWWFPNIGDPNIVPEISRILIIRTPNKVPLFFETPNIEAPP